MFDEYDYQQLMGDDDEDSTNDNNRGYNLDHGGGGDVGSDLGCLLVLAIIIGVIYWICK